MGKLVLHDPTMEYAADAEEIGIEVNEKKNIDRLACFV